MKSENEIITRQTVAIKIIKDFYLYALEKNHKLKLKESFKLSPNELVFFKSLMANIVFGKVWIAKNLYEDYDMKLLLMNDDDLTYNVILNQGQVKVNIKNKRGCLC
jgi:hypothetical protein